MRSSGKAPDSAIIIVDSPFDPAGSLVLEKNASKHSWRMFRQGSRTKLWLYSILFWKVFLKVLWEGYGVLKTCLLKAACLEFEELWPFCHSSCWTFFFKHASRNTYIQPEFLFHLRNCESDRDTFFPTSFRVKTSAVTHSGWPRKVKISVQLKSSPVYHLTSCRQTENLPFSPLEI